MIGNIFWSKPESLCSIWPFWLCSYVLVGGRKGISELIDAKKHLQSDVTVLQMHIDQDLMMVQKLFWMYFSTVLCNCPILYLFLKIQLLIRKDWRMKKVSLPNCFPNAVQRSECVKTTHLGRDSRCVIFQQTTGVLYLGSHRKSLCLCEFPHHCDFFFWLFSSEHFLSPADAAACLLIVQSRVLAPIMLHLLWKDLVRR